MTTSSSPEASIAQQSDAIFVDQIDDNYRRTSRVFAGLMLVQWLAAIVVASVLSPYGFSGKAQSLHPHVYVAVILGAAISGVPALLAIRRPTWVVTRHAVAVGQMLWSALFIHLSGGRIETHFHVFGSLAFLAFYRDWKVLVTATVVVATDHLARGILWPESVYAIANPEWWRFLEHAFWVVFEDVILVLGCMRGVEEVRAVADRQAEIAALSRSEADKARRLSDVLSELRTSHEALMRAEKLAAVGQLSASVGHELRNPLAAVRNAHTYIVKRMDGSPLASDVRVKQFVGIIERELDACSKIIGDLLDFARERPPNLRPCPLRPLVDEAIGVIPARRGVQISNNVAHDAPVPMLDKDQFRQILVNLLQNAVEAVPANRGGDVAVALDGGGERPWKLRITDDGVGIPDDVAKQIFQPLFTTKTKGTGLGLAVVSGLVQRHGGTIEVDSQPGAGTTFLIELSPAVTQEAS